MRLRPNRRRFVATPETILALAACCFVVHEIRGGLNWSMQHWLAVYSPGFQSPRSFAGVD